jgi:hypothetical protein
MDQWIQHSFVACVAGRVVLISSEQPHSTREVVYSYAHSDASSTFTGSKPYTEKYQIRSYIVPATQNLQSNSESKKVAPSLDKWKKRCILDSQIHDCKWSVSLFMLFTFWIIPEEKGILYAWLIASEYNSQYIIAQISLPEPGWTLLYKIEITKTWEDKSLQARLYINCYNLKKKEGNICDKYIWSSGSDA